MSDEFVHHFDLSKFIRFIIHHLWAWWIKIHHDELLNLTYFDHNSPPDHHQLIEKLHNDALNTSAPDSQRMLVPSNQSRRIVIALENVEILHQEKQSCARRGSWSSLPRPPWRTSHTALFPLFSSNAILGSLLLQVYKIMYNIKAMSDNIETQRRPSYSKVQASTLTR